MGVALEEGQRLLSCGQASLAIPAALQVTSDLSLSGDELFLSQLRLSATSLSWSPLRTWERVRLTLLQPTSSSLRLPFVSLSFTTASLSIISSTCLKSLADSQRQNSTSPRSSGWSCRPRPPLPPSLPLSIAASGSWPVPEADCLRLDATLQRM